MPTLHWIGKEKVVGHHRHVPFKTLEHQYHFTAKKEEEKAVPSEALAKNDNKIIHGDNLEALKALLPQYEGKIKCIYIDPPYNTGNEGWVYNDNVNHPKIKKWLGDIVGKEGDDLSRHDKWLCMMYPRLQLLHQLLAQDGAIFISIDDNEQANLKLLCDEIFGNGNFITSIIWQKNYSPKNSAKHFSSDHDFILVYAKQGETWRPNLLPRNATQLSRYKNLDDDPRGPWKTGDFSARNYYGEGIYSITTPSGRVISGPPRGNYWRYSEERLSQLDKDNRIWWGEDGNNTPAIKRFLSEVQDGIVPQTLFKYEEVGHTQEAKKDVNVILNDSDFSFDTPKPTRLVDKILRIASGKGDVILDSFAGTGTTAHAVLNLNKKDGGNRQFILVEMEDYAESITAERVKRVMQGYGEGKKAAEGTGGSFSYYELGLPLFVGDNQEYLNEDVGPQKLSEYVWYSETRSPYQTPKSPNPHYLGQVDGTAYYFVYQPQAITTLDYDYLTQVQQKAEQYVIYADNCLLADHFMEQHHIIFKKIPRDISRF